MDPPPPYSEEPDAPPVPPLPRKNYNVFGMNDDSFFFAAQLWEGKAGELPIFLEVNVGYDPEDSDPYMFPYESGELLFLFKRGSQKRAIIHDSHQRTLSLPLTSDITFIPMNGPAPGPDDAKTLSKILETESVPIRIEFAHKELMEFEVDRQTCNHTFFGDLIFQGVYEENFFWCLAIKPYGRADGVRVLPENLNQVCFSHIDKVKNVTNSDAKLQEFMDKFMKEAGAVDTSQDPFFKELAVVDRGKHIFEGQKLEPYIDQTTFVTIRYKKRPVPAPPGDAPSLPPRNPVPVQADPTPKKAVKKRSTHSKHADGKGSHYSAMVYRNDEDEHEYERIRVEGDEDTKSFKNRSEKDGRGGFADASIYEPTPKADTYPRRHGPQLTDDSESLKRSLSSRNPPPPQPAAPALPPRTGPHGVASHSPQDVESLSIDDVGARLKQLGLKKYRKKFKDNQIDGLLLTKLSESTMEHEFGMSSVDVLKLTTFIKTGHIPR